MPYTPLERKHALERAGLKNVDVARKLGVSEALVTRVLSDDPGFGGVKAWKVRRFVAQQIGVHIEELFPSYARRGVVVVPAPESAPQ